MAVLRIPIDLEYEPPGGPGVNVWHAEVPDSDIEGGLAAVLVLLENFYDAVGSLIPSTTIIRFAGEATAVREDLRVSGPTFALTSTGTDDYLPLATALTVSWRSLFIGRSGSGRTFLGPLSYSIGASNGRPTSGSVLTARSAASALVEANTTLSADGGPSLVVYSRLNDTARTITGFAVRPEFSVLRSRRD